jgi:hypothetical protein
MLRKGREVHMKITFLFLIAIGFACLQPADAQTGSRLTLRAGEEKRDARSKIRVRFIAVTEDSRCPEDTTCVWAGNAKVNVKVRRGAGAWKSIELNTTIAPATVAFEGYEIALADLTPLPRTDTPTDPKRYAATVTIDRR